MICIYDLLIIFCGMLSDLFSLVYPDICHACEESLYSGEKTLCTSCLYHLPKTHYHLEYNNPVMRHFFGRADVAAAASLYFFDKGGKVQRLIHQLKYKGEQEVGVFLGKYYGAELCSSASFSPVDIILPVPLHPTKKARRGYNQSELFAEGLALGMQKKLNTDSLKRIRHSSTQTRKARYERWENVWGIFKVVKPENLEGKHILLADDVITTGATLEACAEVLLQIPGAKVSVVSIACSIRSS